MERFKEVKTAKGANGFITRCMGEPGWEYDPDFLEAMWDEETLDVPGVCIHITKTPENLQVWVTTYDPDTI